MLGDGNRPVDTRASSPSLSKRPTQPAAQAKSSATGWRAPQSIARLPKDRARTACGRQRPNDSPLHKSPRECPVFPVQGQTLLAAANLRCARLVRIDAQAGSPSLRGSVHCVDSNPLTVAHARQRTRRGFRAPALCADCWSSSAPSGPPIRPARQRR